MASLLCTIFILSLVWRLFFYTLFYLTLTFETLMQHTHLDILHRKVYTLFRFRIQKLLPYFPCPTTSYFQSLYSLYKLQVSVLILMVHSSKYHKLSDYSNRNCIKFPHVSFCTFSRPFQIFSVYTKLETVLNVY